MLLRRRPDRVFEVAGGSYHIVDYKISQAPERAKPTALTYGCA